MSPFVVPSSFSFHRTSPTVALSDLRSLLTTAHIAMTYTSMTPAMGTTCITGRDPTLVIAVTHWVVRERGGDIAFVVRFHRQTEYFNYVEVT
jgi:hypothetical protein